MFTCSPLLRGELVSPNHHFFIFSAAMKEEKPEDKDLLADLQDISDSERKTSSADSSMGIKRFK